MGGAIQVFMDSGDLEGVGGPVPHLSDATMQKPIGASKRYASNTVPEMDPFVKARSMFGQGKKNADAAGRGRNIKTLII